MRCLNAAGVEEPGVVVRATAVIGGATNTLRRDLNGGGFRSTEPLLAHFGLGDATNITNLRVEWPSGKAEAFANMAVNQLLTLTETSLGLVTSALALAPGARGAFEALPGGEKFSYQWQFQSADLPGETHRILGFPNVTTNQAGTYTLRATGSQGVVELTATLSVVTTLNDALVACWPFDGDANDATGRGHNGVASGAAPAPDRLGTPGKAFAFDGQSSFITVPDSIDFAFGGGDFTICYWLKEPLTYAQSGKVCAIMGQTPGGVTDKWYLFAEHPYASPEFTVGSPSISNGSDGALAYVFRGAFNSTTDKWQHWALVRQGSAWKVFLNGQVFEVGIYSGDVPDAVAPLTIGEVENQHYLLGTLDNLRIYRRALSRAEVAAQYNSESPQWLSFTQPPQGGTFAAGQTVNFSVQAQGVGVLNYQWLRDGQPLPAATNATLTLANSHPVQSGNYTVTVSNAAGSATSSGATVQINPVYQFARVNAGPLTTDVSNTEEAHWVDYDHDGYLDLFLVCVSEPNRLYRNNGIGGFDRMDVGALTRDVAGWTVW